MDKTCLVAEEHRHLRAESQERSKRSERCLITKLETHSCDSDLFWTVNELGIYTQCYEDDFVILIRSKRKREETGNYTASLCGGQKQVGREFKYLGAKLDDKLTWNCHLDTHNQPISYYIDDGKTC
ncbi:hypothetical protein J6590_044963 [Homalodisca vitripennis]|nr:hypothetical protein J6590_044963 [Homalodisca vitripennis]